MDEDMLRAMMQMMWLMMRAFTDVVGEDFDFSAGTKDGPWGSGMPWTGGMPLGMGGWSNPWLAPWTGAAMPQTWMGGWPGAWPGHGNTGTPSLGAWPGQWPPGAATSRTPWIAGPEAASPWTGQAPSGARATPNPWSGQVPWGGGSSDPWSDGYPGTVPQTGHLDGVWQSQSGERFLVRGNRFRLESGPGRQGQGIFMLMQDQLVIYSPDSNLTHTYRYQHNGDWLALRDPSGQVLLFQRVG